jgi:hypothetical protein
VNKLLWFPILSAALLVNCGRAPDPHAPPSQKDSLITETGGPLGSSVSMEDPNSSSYVVRGFADRSEGTWRWAYDHPALRFWGPDLPKVNYMMDFAIPEKTFRLTGPVTLTIKVNGSQLDRLRVTQAGQQHYIHEIPPAMLKKNAANEVAIEPDKVYTAPGDNAKLSFVLVRAGFVE